MVAGIPIHNTISARACMDVKHTQLALFLVFFRKNLGRESRGKALRNALHRKVWLWNQQITKIFALTNVKTKDPICMLVRRKNQQEYPKQGFQAIL